MKALLLSLLLSTASQAVGQQYLSARFAGVFDRQRTFVLITIADPYSPKKHGSIQHFWGGDGSGYRPETVASSLQLIVGGVRMHLPREALIDLGDPGLPYGPTLWGDHGEIMVEWHGGDAAGGYTSRLSQEQVGTSRDFSHARGCPHQTRGCEGVQLSRRQWPN